MLKNIQVAAFSLQYAFCLIAVTKDNWANINIQRCCKILQNRLKPLMSYQQEAVGSYFFWRALYL